MSLINKKLFFADTQRLSSPADTLKNIKDLINELGITRIADITGLDRLNIPTMISIRPLSKSISVSSGKGIDPIQSTVSAAMESIELHYAENVTPDFSASYNNLIDKYTMIPLGKLPVRKNSFYNPEINIDWMVGNDILNNIEVPVPFEMVCMDHDYSRKKNSLLHFQVGSNGLASGNNYIEAVISAIYEVIERDAVTLSKIKGYSDISISKIDPNQIPFENIQAILENIYKSEIVPVIFDTTSDIGIPTFAVTLYDIKENDFGCFGGFGTHLSSEIALLRAITEAAQNRCVYIAGARDDLYSHDFMLPKKAFTPKNINNFSKKYRDLNHYQIVNSPLFETDLKTIINCLKIIGIEQVIVLELTPRNNNIAVVKVVIPGLEGYYSEIYSPGERAKRVSRLKNIISHSGVCEEIHKQSGKGY